MAHQLQHSTNEIIQTCRHKVEMSTQRQSRSVHISYLTKRHALSVLFMTNYYCSLKFFKVKLLLILNYRLSILRFFSPSRVETSV